ncbi:MAG: DUF2807 domain-containing protein [Bacteroidota bacterium]|nr:DUF2807 domain-containing protein [Bacteroidota bacterium]
MKKIILAAIVLLGAMPLTKAQDTKNVVYDANAEIRKVSDFTGVDVSNAISLYLSQGKESAVAISVDGGDKEKVKTEVKNGVLKIYIDGGFWSKMGWNSSHVKAYVTAKDINKLTASGASRIVIAEKISVGNLKLTLTGASSLKGDLKADNLKAELSGASSMKSSISANNLKVGLSGASTASLSGAANILDIDASGASNLKAYDLAAISCSAEASGASSIKVNVSKEFSKVQASGASSIHYKGDAAVKNFEASGASSIKKDGSK